LVDAIQVLRGYRLINVVTLAAEIGDPRRFPSPRPLMAFVGTVPSGHSTGDRVRRGGITKTGNSRARKALIEAAWTYSHPIRAASPAHPVPEVRVIAEKARHRLSRRYRQLRAQGKLAPVAATAIARESLGFIWAIPGGGAGRYLATPRRFQKNKIAANKKETFIHHRAHRRCSGLEASRRKGSPRPSSGAAFRPTLELSARHPGDAFMGQVGTQPTHQRSINRRNKARFLAPASASRLLKHAAHRRAQKNCGFFLQKRT